MKSKEQKIKIVYEEVDVIEYVLQKSIYDDFKSRKLFLNKKNQYEN